MDCEDCKGSVRSKSILELMEDIEIGGYKCEAGPLEKNIDWQEMKERVAEKPTTYADRLIVEKEELNTKMHKLREFLDKEKKEPKFLDAKQMEMMEKQFEAMKEYHDILMTRMAYEDIDC